MMEAAQGLWPEVSLAESCQAMGVSRATLHRRRQASETPRERKLAKPSPRALRPDERAEVRRTLCSERFVDRSPRAVHAALLDDGVHLCSVRTMYRILQDEDSVHERRNQRRHPSYTKPELLATRPNEVWSWDITKLLGPEKWTYYYLYVILDIFSRYVVGWMLAHRESAELASRLLRETIKKQGVSSGELIVHSDRGPSMSSHNVAQLLAQLGVVKSHSRPHVSNDNPFSESQFKTMKYRPEFPSRFGCYEDASSFSRSFFGWYNDEHYHEGLGMLTPTSVHYGQAEQVLAARHEVLRAAYAKNPERFVRGCPKHQSPPVAVWINPPTRTSLDDQKRPPETNCPRRPEASLTHPRPGYPSSSCVPAELDSVSPGEIKTSEPSCHDQASLNTRAMPQKIPGVWGLAPDEAELRQPTEKMLH